VLVEHLNFSEDQKSIRAAHHCRFMAHRRCGRSALLNKHSEIVFPLRLRNKITATAPEISRLGSFPVPESQPLYSASEMLVPHLPSQPPSVPYPYNRWPADNPSPFPGTLSTSVLPQVYSTGLFDDRAVAVNGQRVSSSALDPNAQTRFPQYWNDYSTYSQLGNYEFNDQQSQSHASPSHAFFSESYNRHI